MNVDHQVGTKQHQLGIQNTGDDGNNINQHSCNMILVPKLQPLLKMNKNKSLFPIIDQKYDTNFLNNQIQAMLKRSSDTKLIEEFLPFDCNLLEFFDEQQLCTEPTLKYAIVPYSYLRFGDKYFGGEEEQNIMKDMIVKVQQHIKYENKMDKMDKEQVYYVQKFKRIIRSKLLKQIQKEQKESMMYGYKMYKITKVRKQEGQEVQIQKQLTQIPLHDIIMQPLLLDCVQVSSIIIKQISGDEKSEQRANNTKPIYEIILVVSSIKQRRDSSIYSVKYAAKNQKLDVLCDNLDGLVTQLYCLGLQINTFYAQSKQQFTHQPYYYLYEEQQMLPSLPKNRLINELWQKQINNNNIRFCHLLKYKGQSIQHASHMKLQQKDIYNLFKILVHFHKIQNISLSDTTYKCFPSNKIPSKNIVIFTNFASATTLTSKEQQAYDIVTLIGKILDANYQGKYATKLQDIAETANEDEIIFKFEYLLNGMHKLFL